MSIFIKPDRKSLTLSQDDRSFCNKLYKEKRKLAGELAQYTFITNIYKQEKDVDEFTFDKFSYKFFFDKFIYKLINCIKQIYVSIIIQSSFNAYIHSSPDFKTWLKTTFKIQNLEKQIEPLSTYMNQLLTHINQLFKYFTKFIEGSRPNTANISYTNLEFLGKEPNLISYKDKFITKLNKILNDFLKSLISKKPSARNEISDETDKTIGMINKLHLYMIEDIQGNKSLHDKLFAQTAKGTFALKSADKFDLKNTNLKLWSPTAQNERREEAAKLAGAKAEAARREHDTTAKLAGAKKEKKPDLVPVQVVPGEPLGEASTLMGTSVASPSFTARAFQPLNRAAAALSLRPAAKPNPALLRADSAPLFLHDHGAPPVFTASDAPDKENKSASRRGRAQAWLSTALPRRSPKRNTAKKGAHDGAPLDPAAPLDTGAASDTAAASATTGLGSPPTYEGATKPPQRAAEPSSAYRAGVMEHMRPSAPPTKPHGAAPTKPHGAAATKPHGTSGSAAGKSGRGLVSASLGGSRKRNKQKRPKQKKYSQKIARRLKKKYSLKSRKY